MSKKKQQKRQPCRIKGCRRLSRPGYKMCTTCDKKIWREKYPMKAAFQTLRQNARRRKKPFAITFEYFRRFCYRTKYMAGKGRTKDSFSIDCKKNELGYVKGNIRKLTVAQNAAKGTKKLVYDWETKHAFVVTEIKTEDTDNPF